MAKDTRKINFKCMFNCSSVKLAINFILVIRMFYVSNYPRLNGKDFVFISVLYVHFVLLNKRRAELLMQLYRWRY